LEHCVNFLQEVHEDIPVTGKPYLYDVRRAMIEQKIKIILEIKGLLKYYNK